MTQQAEPHVIGDDAPDATSAERCDRSGRAPHGDGFGAAFCASMAALCAEAVIGGTAAVLVMLSREHDGIPGNIPLVLALALGVLLLTVLVSGFVTASVVMPALALARRLARARDRTAGPWWTVGAVPVVSAVTVAVFGAVAALGSLSLAPPLAYLLWWGALTVVLLPATLAGRVAARRVREGRAGSVARRVTRDGLLASLVVGALGAGAYGTGLVSVYEPPRLATSDFAGMWTDGRGGTVRLASDGNAVAHGLDNFVWDGTGKDRPTDCDGSGTWKPVRTEGTVRGVFLRIGACDLTRDWTAIGTQKGPRIYHEIGKPGSGKRYVLTKVVRHRK